MANNRGAIWHRWEPHIHAPETLINDQFKGEDKWDAYFSELEKCEPKIEALAVTDYYLTHTYEEVLKGKENGRLPDIKLFFPNIELRLDIATTKSGWVNLHLLVSPEDSDHLEKAKGFVGNLRFRANHENYNCTRDDLIRLARTSAPANASEKLLLEHGATQFKVSFDQLREEFDKSKWAQENILVAVSGNKNDGTSGVNQAADATLRREIEKFANIVFSGNPKDADYWLGNNSSVEEINETYGNLKPCLHGSDAHTIDKIGKPDLDRRTWIKGALTFDALRQAVIEPKGRVHIGDAPPTSPMPSFAVDSIKIENSDWAKTPEIPLNSGLATIIGARGSGKTALADIIAAGCQSLSQENMDNSDSWGASFLGRAQGKLGEGTVALQWGNGEKSSSNLEGYQNPNDYEATPRARYLSQKFVEDLCSAATGPSRGLINEVERVIFEAHDDSAREGSLNFSELRERKTFQHGQAREAHTKALEQVSKRMAEELEKEASVSALTQQQKNKNDEVEKLKSDLKKIVIKGSETEQALLARLNEAKLGIEQKIEGYRRQLQIFESMKSEVDNMRSADAPEMLRAMQARYPYSGLDEQKWNEFLLNYTGDVDKSLPSYIQWAKGEQNKLIGQQVVPPAEGASILSPTSDIDKATLNELKYEMGRVQGQLQTTKQVQDQYAALQKKILLEQRNLKAIEEKLKDAKEATERKTKLQEERRQTYRQIFDAIVAEENELRALYAPLEAKLKDSPGTLSKLSLTIFRTAKTEEWAEFAEENLLDLRGGKFMGKGELTSTAKAELHPHWVGSSAEDISEAMEKFISDHWNDIHAYGRFVSNDQNAKREWISKFAQWIFSTNHVSVGYGIQYDGIDLEKLSPGTRGIVLLLLYLALDDDDTRPLIIDQPEENLDPQSINVELVPLFIAAKSRRQVIMVTHNANLVVNTDADQVIIARTDGHAANGLPNIFYRSGGLEEAEIRKEVCEILEGGEEAFRDRARRLRIKFRN